MLPLQISLQILLLKQILCIFLPPVLLQGQITFLFLTLAFDYLLCPGLIRQTPEELIATEDMTTHTGYFSFFPDIILVLFILPEQTNKVKSLQ